MNGLTDKQLLKIARGFRKGMLEGGDSAFMCRAICLPLQGLLSAVYGIEAEVVDGSVDICDMYHTWLRLPDGRVLDPTADQFGLGLPPVYLGPMPEHYSIPERREVSTAKRATL